MEKSSVILILFMSSIVWLTNAETASSVTVKEFPLEIAVIVDDSLSVKDPQFELMTDVIKDLTTYFTISDQMSRVGVVVFGQESKVEMELASDAEFYRDTVEKIRNHRMRGKYTNTHLALNDVKYIIFLTARPDVQKVVILLTDGGATKRDEAEEAADELRDSGAFVYVVYIGEAYRTLAAIQDHVDKVAGTHTHVFLVDKFEELKATIFKQIHAKVLEGIRCKYQEVCRFNDSSRQNCVHQWWREFDHHQTGQCVNDPPRSNRLQCNNDTCDRVCDKQWPWMNETCGKDGKTVTQIRNQEVPQKLKEILKFCPQKKDVFCPTRTAKSTTAETTEKSTEPFQPVKAVTEEKSRDDPKPFPIWAIILIALVGLALLAFVAAIVVVRIRKRKKAKLMMKKKADGELHDHQHHHEHMGQMHAADGSTSKSAYMDVSMTSELKAKFAKSGGTAGQNVGVSLHDSEAFKKKGGRMQKTLVVSETGEQRYIYMNLDGTSKQGSMSEGRYQNVGVSLAGSEGGLGKKRGKTAAMTRGAKSQYVGVSMHDSKLPDSMSKKRGKMASATRGVRSQDMRVSMKSAYWEPQAKDKNTKTRK